MPKCCLEQAGIGEFVADPFCKVAAQVKNSLINDVSDTAPVHTAPTGAIPTEPDEECFADNELFRNKTPISAVIAVIAVISHHEVVSRAL